MMLVGNYNNCGLHELSGLTGLQANRYPALAAHLCDHQTGMIIFHDNITWGNGVKLAEWIEKNKLGSIVRGPECENPTHPQGGKITAWIWDPDYKALKAIAGEADKKAVTLQYFSRAEVQTMTYQMVERRREVDKQISIAMAAAAKKEQDRANLVYVTQSAQSVNF